MDGIIHRSLPKIKPEDIILSSEQTAAITSVFVAKALATAVHTLDSVCLKEDPPSCTFVVGN